MSDMPEHSSTGRRGRARAAACAAALLAGTVVATPSASAASSCVVAAAGDVAAADTYRTGAARTAELIRSARPARLLALGDLAYSSGSRQEFRDYYRPTWGRLKSITEAVPGNHEARTAGFRGLEGELGDSADDNRAITVCGWRIVLLNQYKGIGAAASFLRAEGRAHPSQPLIAVWHEPRFSSGKHGSNRAMQPLWDAARGAHARIVLSGHDHVYERFAPRTSDGSVSTANGTRQFVSGLGGAEERPFRTVAARSEKRWTGKPAVLFLTLRGDGGYSWVARSVDGVVRDSGRQPAPR